jgi:glutamate/aspartate transport system substrate-binding protein
MRHPVIAAGVSLLAAALLANAASAQSSGGEGLSPTLAAIKSSHVVHLGYRESSPPFSFLDASNRPIGYSLELCEAVVDEIGVEVDEPALRIDYVKVTSDDRIAAVTQGKIDLECGSTTASQSSRLYPIGRLDGSMNENGGELSR